MKYTVVTFAVDDAIPYAEVFDEKGNPVRPSTYGEIRRALVDGERRRRVQLARDAVETPDLWRFPRHEDALPVRGNVVYFIESDARPSQIKIGKTQDLKGRLSGIRNQFDAPARVLAYIEIFDNRQAETELHIMFNGARVEGEWFEAEPLVHYINVFKGLVQ